MTKKTSGCSGGCTCLTKTCYYDVRITVDTALPGCDKEDDKSLSHVCWQQGADLGGVCPTTTPTIKFWAPELPEGADPFTTYYNVGNEGGTLYFVTKDGPTCNTTSAGETFYVDIVNATGGDTGFDATVLCKPETPDVVSTKCADLVLM